MERAFEIDLGGMPAGDLVALKAFIRPGAVLARILLERNGIRMSRRVDLGKGVFIDLPDFGEVGCPADQSAAVCTKIVQAISHGGPLADSYRQTPCPATIVLQPF